MNPAITQDMKRTWDTFNVFLDSSLPSLDELYSLPRWACVAAATRCARRVQPFIVSPHNSIISEARLNNSELAILASEKMARTAGRSDRDLLRLAVNLSFAAVTGGDSIHKSGGRLHQMIELARAFQSNQEDAAVTATLAAAECAWLTCIAESGKQVHPFLVSFIPLCSTEICTAELSRGLSKLDQIDLLMLQAPIGRAIGDDLDFLIQMTKRCSWNDNSPVDVGLFPDLWPKGIPSRVPHIQIPSIDTELEQRRFSELSKSSTGCSLLFIVLLALLVFPFAVLCMT